MALPSRAFENLAVQITATALRVDAGLRAPDPAVSADILLLAKSDMERLTAKVRAAAVATDLASRRPVTR